MSVAWSNIEVELIVADYFNMLSKELKDESYSKKMHRRALLPLLNNRSEGSIEFKHQNISAVLINLGQPYIKGYLPRFNYQKALEYKVIEALAQNIGIENHFKTFADKEIIKPIRDLRFDNFIVTPPLLHTFTEHQSNSTRNPIKINYLEREQNNRSLGLLGEELIFEYEKWNLVKNGMERYANQVRWISKEEGDGVGFDILSKNENGKDKYIEVKTTKLRKETPFFFSRNELLFSQEHSNNYYLYRLFNFENEPQMFTKLGKLNEICHSIPMTYKGFF